ncbi:MAG: O-antigen ligase family protein [Nitrospirota bacterium]
MDRRDISGSKITVAATVVLMASVLLFGSVEVWSSALIEASVFTLFLVWVVGRCRQSDCEPAGREEGRRDRMALFFIFLCFGGYIMIQTVPLPPAVMKIVSPATFNLHTYYAVDKDAGMSLSVYPYRTQIEFVRVLAAAAFLVLLAYGTRSAHTLEKTVKILSYFGFGLAVFALIQKATWNDKLYWFREITHASPFGPFVNRNHFAGFTGMLIPLTLGIAFTRARRERQVLFGFFALIMAVALFLSLSRAGIVSFFCGIAIFALYLLWNRFRAKKMWAVAAFLLVLFLYLLYLGVDPIIDRFYKTDIGSEERLIVWTETLGAFRDFALTGTGLGTYVHVFPLYSSDTSLFIYDHAHNDYLEFILETGVIGALLLVLSVFFFIRSSFRGPWSGKQGIMKMALFSSLATIAVHSVFDFNLHILSNVLMLSAVSGMAFAQARMSRLPESASEEPQIQVEV